VLVLIRVLFLIRYDCMYALYTTSPAIRIDLEKKYANI